MLPRVALAQVISEPYWYTGDMNDSHNMRVSSLDPYWSAVNHIIVGSIEVQSDGSITTPDHHANTNMPLIVNACHSHGCKALIDIDPNGDLNGAIAHHLSFTTANITSWVNTYGFDGVEIDWENNFNTELNNLFVHALRGALGTKLIAQYVDVNLFSYYGGPINTYLDQIIPFGYDDGGCVSGASWFNSAIYNDPSGPGSGNSSWSWELIRTRFLKSGVPQSKLLMAMTFLADLYNGTIGPRKPCGSETATRYNYADLASSFNISSPARDSVTHEAWIPVSSNSWLNFQDATSLTDKVRYVQKENLGGWVMFNLFADYMPHQTIKHPLLAAIQAAMKANFLPRASLR